MSTGAYSASVAARFALRASNPLAQAGAQSQAGNRIHRAGGFDFFVFTMGTFDSRGCVHCSWIALERSHASASPLGSAGRRSSRPVAFETFR